MDSHKRSTQLERLEVVETGRRRRWSDDEKLRIVTESLQAPRAISSTARRHGISRSLLMTWRRSFGPEPISSPQGEQSGFARVVLAAEVEPSVAATSAGGQMVIVVGRDRRVIVDAGVDAAALARVLQVLERR
jgi:transposase